ncbi:MAG TPA: hypothetical protein VJ842_03895 [Pyrinomonadaceae bacterium]|nr:hypothetical protein [Pyrinomonadaceae bacterium]
MNSEKEPDDDKNVESTSAEAKRPEPQDEPLPADFEKEAKQRFGKLKTTEITLEQYIEREKAEFYRLRALEKDPALKYQPTLGTMTPCGNGDFEKELNPAEWQGAYGALNSGSPGNINFGALTSGILSGSITAQDPSNKYDFSQQAHQTWVGVGTDPYVGIPTTAQGSSGAIRIGNAVTGAGCELLSKTFVVTPAASTIKFWYAAVLQNPDPATHAMGTQPYFMVRVTDAAGNVVPGAFDFGTGSGNILVADANNPFFQKVADPKSAEFIVYKDWSCAQIDLSTQVGKQVTIEFVTADCWHTGHWGYAYVDSFCGDCHGSPTGDITYNCEASTHCGPGRICFNYSLPTTKATPTTSASTGSVVITLDIYQNGTLLTTFTSPTLTSGRSHCFDITPASFPGINTALGGFDFVATGTFAIGSTPLGHIKVGSAPDGIEPGQNNDYLIACKSCAEIKQEQEVHLNRECAKKVNFLPRTNCDCPDSGAGESSECRCTCVAVKLPEIKPCISVSWGDSPCDCLETDDVEVLCISVCNCYTNVTFKDLTIARIVITDTKGNPVPVLPDGTPSVQVFPSGPICFGDIRPCRGKNRPYCVSRELVVYTRGAKGGSYRLSFEGVCFSVSHEFQSEHCYVVELCQD